MGEAKVEKRIINPAGLAPPRGFSHGISVDGGRTLYIAGQDASGGDGRIVAPGDLVAQFEQALSNLKTVAEEAGGAITDIVKMTIFVASRAEYTSRLKEIGRVFRKYFGDYYPAMALFEISGFFQPEALVEIEAIAVIAKA